MKNLLAISCLFLLIACQHTTASFEEGLAYGGELTQTEASKASEAYSQDANEQPSNKLDVMPERKIIKTADMQMEVEELDQATQAIRDSLGAYQAFLSETNLNNNTHRSGNQMTIRVPQQHFDPLLDALSSIAVRIDHRRINTSDVTEEYLDIETRLKTKKEVRDRYIAILRDKAKTVKDILDAEDKIRVIQEEIESGEGRLRYLSHKVGLSTIRISIYQNKAYQGIVKERSFLAKAGKAFISGWTGVQNFALGLIYVWPFLLLALMIAFLIGRARSKKRELAKNQA